MNNQVKLIDVDKERLVQKLREYARQFVTPQLCKDLSDAANIIEVLISPPVPTIKPGDKVRHVSIGTNGLAVETSDIGVFVHWSTGQRSWYPYASLEVVE